MNSLQHKWNQILETSNLTSPARPGHQACLSLAYNSFHTFKAMLLHRGYDLFWIDTDGDASPFAGAPQKLLVPPTQRPRSPFIVLDSLQQGEDTTTWITPGALDDRHRARLGAALP